MTQRLRTRASADEAADPLQVRALHTSPTVSIYDVRCRPHDFGRGPEEWSSTDQIVLPRRGVFARETRGETTRADANQGLFFGRDETSRVAHPGGCGDECSVLVFDAAVLSDAVQQHDPAAARVARERAVRPFIWRGCFAATRASPCMSTACGCGCAKRCCGSPRRGQSGRARAGARLRGRRHARRRAVVRSQGRIHMRRMPGERTHRMQR